MEPDPGGHGRLLRAPVGPETWPAVNGTSLERSVLGMVVEVPAHERSRPYTENS